jgi:hypothetical protein
VTAGKQAVTGLYRALETVRRALVGRTSAFSRAFIVEETFGKTKSDSDVWTTFQRMQDTSSRDCFRSVDGGAQ